jgi:hypothetical protein
MYLGMFMASDIARGVPNKKGHPGIFLSALINYIL